MGFPAGLLYIVTCDSCNGSECNINMTITCLYVYLQLLDMTELCTYDLMTRILQAF